MALDSQIDAADRAGRRRKRKGKKPDADAMSANVEPLYLRDTRVYDKMHTMAAFQLEKEYRHYGSIKTEDEYNELIEMLGLEKYIEYGRDLYRTSGNIENLSG